MGYRSQVVIGITKDIVVPDKVREYLEECDIVEHNMSQSGSNITPEDPYGEETTDEDILTTYYTWEATKWYDDYDEVKGIMDFLHAIPDDQEDCWGFVRVGEDDGDVEREGGTSELGMWIRTEIVLDY